MILTVLVSVMVSGFTAVTRCDAFVRRSPIVARCHRYVTWLGQASRAPGLLQLGPQLGLAADRPAGALPFAWIDHWKATRQARAVTAIARAPKKGSPCPLLNKSHPRNAA